MLYLFRPNILLVIGIISISVTSCSKPITRDKVSDNIEDARDATEEAKEATLKALEAREQLYVDYRETKIEELEDRIDNIDKSIKDLQKSSKDSENRGAENNISSAIAELETERNNLRREIDNVNAIQQRDWSTSYENVNRAILQLEQEIQKLSESMVDFQ